MQNVTKEVKIWYDQEDMAVCINYGMAMLFSYKTGIKIPLDKINDYTKTLQRKLEEGFMGYRCEFQILKKPVNPAGVKTILFTFGPLVVDLNMFKDIDYSKEVIGSFPKTLPSSIGGHRILVLGYDYRKDMVLLANTWGLDKVQKMPLIDFYRCMRRFVFMGCFPLEKTKEPIRDENINYSINSLSYVAYNDTPTIPMKYDRFGYDYLDSIKSSLGKGFHPGLDFNWGKLASSDIGLPVVSTLPGTVVFSKKNGGNGTGWGNLIVIKHRHLGQDIYSRYAHLQKRLVVEKEEVKKGQTIGTCGNTGASFGPHLHFDIFSSTPKSFTEYVYGLSKISVQKKYLDPYSFLKIKKL